MGLELVSHGHKSTFETDVPSGIGIDLRLGHGITGCADNDFRRP